MKPTSSATISTQQAGSPPESGTGIAPSTIGSAGPPKVASAAQREMRPMEVEDRLQASLGSRLTSCLDMDLDSEMNLLRFRMRGRPPANELADALERHEAACRPADRDTLVKELAALRLSCVSRDMSEQDLRAQTEVYAQRLAEWPADAAVTALREWSRRSKFFPAWAELEAVIREHCDERLKRREALRKAYERGQTDDGRDVGGTRYSTAADAERAHERRTQGTTDLSERMAELRRNLEAQADDDDSGGETEAA